MREIQASDAKAHLPQILDDVEHGETSSLPDTAEPSRGSCRRRCAGPRRSIRRSTASSSFASTPDGSQSANFCRLDAKGTNIDPLRPRRIGRRRGRLTEVDTATFLRSLSRLGISIDRSPEETEVLALGRRHRLSVYDASYLELARREAIPLATLDTELARAARSENLSLVGADA